MVILPIFSGITIHVPTCFFSCSPLLADAFVKRGGRVTTEASGMIYCAVIPTSHDENHCIRRPVDGCSTSVGQGMPAMRNSSSLSLPLPLCDTSTSSSATQDGDPTSCTWSKGGGEGGGGTTTTTTTSSAPPLLTSPSWLNVIPSFCHRARIVVVYDTWIDACIREEMLLPLKENPPLPHEDDGNHYYDHYYDHYDGCRRPLLVYDPFMFRGVRFTTSQLPKCVKQNVTALLIYYGAAYSPDLTMDTDMLVFFRLHCSPRVLLSSSSSTMDSPSPLASSSPSSLVECEVNRKRCTEHLPCSVALPTPSASPRDEEQKERSVKKWKQGTSQVEGTAEPRRIPCAGAEPYTALTSRRRDGITQAKEKSEEERREEEKRQRRNGGSGGGAAPPLLIDGGDHQQRHSPFLTPPSRKLRTAMEHNILCVTPGWVQQCVYAGRLLAFPLAPNLSFSFPCSSTTNCCSTSSTLIGVPPGVGAGTEVTMTVSREEEEGGGKHCPLSAPSSTSRLVPPCGSGACPSSSSASLEGMHHGVEGVSAHSVERTSSAGIEWGENHWSEDGLTSSSSSFISTEVSSCSPSPVRTGTAATRATISDAPWLSNGFYEDYDPLFHRLDEDFRSPRPNFVIESSASPPPRGEKNKKKKKNKKNKNKKKSKKKNNKKKKKKSQTTKEVIWAIREQSSPAMLLPPSPQNKRESFSLSVIEHKNHERRTS